MSPLAQARETNLSKNREGGDTTKKGIGKNLYFIAIFL